MIGRLGEKAIASFDAGAIASTDAYVSDTSSVCARASLAAWSPPVAAAGARFGAAGAATAAVGVGATDGTAAVAGPAEPSSLIIASTTSPTVCVRESAATSCASTLSSFCTSERISTRLIESTPSSVSSAMSISIMSGSYPVLAASTASTTSVAFAGDTPDDGAAAAAGAD